MYTFVFNWVPTMYGVAPGMSPVQGYVFSCLMVCVTIGGIINDLCSKMGARPAVVGLGIFCLAAAALSLPMFASQRFVAVLTGFTLFEVSQAPLAADGHDGHGTGRPGMGQGGRAA